MGNIFSSSKAQTPGISPSSTEESHSKIQANEPVIAAENGKKTPVSTEDKIPEEPESNDTSYGVEATAVRTLAASTGTVAILGTTAKTLATESSEGQDEPTNEDGTGAQENLPTSKSPEEPSNKTDPGRTEETKEEVTGSSLDFIDASPAPHMPVESVTKTEETAESIHTEDVIEIEVKEDKIDVQEKEKPNTPLEPELQKTEIPVQSEQPTIDVVQPTEQTINQTIDAEEIKNNLVEAISATETPVDKEQDNKEKDSDNSVSVSIEPISVPEADNPPQDSEQTTVKKEDEIALTGQTEKQNEISQDLKEPSEVPQIETETEKIVADVIEVKSPEPSKDERYPTPPEQEIPKQASETKDESPMDKPESDSMEELLMVAENVDSGNESDIKDTATNTPETLVVSESADDLQIVKDDNTSGTTESELIPNQTKDPEESVPVLNEPSNGSSAEDEANLKKEETATETPKEVKPEEEVVSAASEVKLVYESNGQHIVLGVDEEDITKSISSEQLQTNSASDVSISESYNVEMEEANGKSDLVVHRNDIGGSLPNAGDNTRNITIVLTNENNDVVDRESEEIKREMEYLQDVKNLEETKKKINDDSPSDEHEEKVPVEESPKQEGEETTSTETLSSCKGTDEDSEAKIPSPTPKEETKPTAPESVEEVKVEAVKTETSAPEEVDNSILNSAATTIQASFRGYQTRQSLQKETLKTNKDAEVRSGNATPPELTNSMIESVKEEVDEICQKAIETTESIINSPSSAPIDDILHQSEKMSAEEQKETEDVMKTLDQSIEGQEELPLNESNALEQSAITTEAVQERPKSSEGEQDQTHKSTEVTVDAKKVSENQQGQLISTEDNKEDEKSLQKQDSLNSDPNDTLLINDDSSNGDLSKEFVPPEVPTGQNDEINEAMADFPPPAPEDDYIFGEQVADEELPPPDFDALESSYTDDIETEVPIPLASPEHKPVEDVKDSTDGEVTIDEDSDDLKLLQRPQECAELPHQQGLDPLQSEALEAAAATKIQAGVRGYLTRKQVQHIKNEPIIQTESNTDNKIVEPTEVEMDADEENIINKAKEMTISSTVTGGDRTDSEVVEENNKNQIEEKKLTTNEQDLDGLTEAATTIQAGFRGYKVRKELQGNKKTTDGSENGTQGIPTDPIRSTGEFHDMIALSPLSVEVKAQAGGILPSTSKESSNKIKKRGSTSESHREPELGGKKHRGDPESKDAFKKPVDEPKDIIGPSFDHSFFEPTQMPCVDFILSSSPLQDNEQIEMKSDKNRDEVTINDSLISGNAEEENRYFIPSYPSARSFNEENSSRVDELQIAAKNIGSSNETDIMQLVCSKSNDDSQIDKGDNVSGTMETDLIENQIKNRKTSVPTLVEIVEQNHSAVEENQWTLEKLLYNNAKATKNEEEATSTVSKIKPDLFYYLDDIGQSHQHSDANKEETIFTPSEPEGVDQSILDTAATTIQASFRGYQTRRNLEKQRSANTNPLGTRDAMLESIKDEIMVMYQNAVENPDCSDIPTSASIDKSSENLIEPVTLTFDQFIEDQEELLKNLSDILNESVVSAEDLEKNLESSDGVQGQACASIKATGDSELFTLPFLTNQQLLSGTGCEETKSLSKEESQLCEPNVEDVVFDVMAMNGVQSEEIAPPDALVLHKNKCNEALATIPPTRTMDDYIYGGQVIGQHAEPVLFDIDTEVPVAPSLEEEDLKELIEKVFDGSDEELKQIQWRQECAELPHQRGMDPHRSEALEAAAATKIQAGVRGYLTRKEVLKKGDGKHKKHANVYEEKTTNTIEGTPTSSTLDDRLRLENAASEVVDDKKSNSDLQSPDRMTKAPTTIQAGYSIRKQLRGDMKTTDGSKNGTRGIQTETIPSTGESHDLTLPVEVQDVAVEKSDLITERESHQRRKKGKMVKRKLTEEEDAATLIQSTFRGYKTRQDLRKINEAATTIQANFRGYKVRKTKGRKHTTDKSRDDRSKQISSEMDNVQNESATKIQAGIRGFLVRKRQKTEREAAVKIQAGFRGFKVRQQIKQNQK